MRQLLVADEVTVAYAGGVLAAGAVDVQKRAADLSNSVTKLPADTIAQAPQIRLVQGTPEGKNIVTPWISGTDVIAWKKATYTVGQVAQSTTLTFAGVPFVAGGLATVKLIGLNQGQAQFERKSYTIEVGPATAIIDAATFAVELEARILADTPSFIAAVAEAGAVVTLTGSLFSLSVSPTTELGNFRVSSEGFDNGVTIAVATAVQPSLGIGSAEVLAQYEKSLKGNRSFYNRVELPNTPPSYIDVATPGTYDVYSIVVENGSVGQIKGVDNLRSITVAFASGGGAANVAFDLTLNNWMISLPGAFPNV